MDRYKLTSPEMEDVPAFAELSEAVMAYTRLVVAGTPAKITDLAGLPGLPVVVAEYEPSPQRAIRVRLGKAEPAFPRERRIDDTHAYAEALWYAKGFIACTGALSPFDPQSDPVAFAEWQTRSEYPNIGQAWSVWTENRRKEIDR